MRDPMFFLLSRFVIFVILICVSGCTTQTNPEHIMVCFQNEDYLAFSMIVNTDYFQFVNIDVKPFGEINRQIDTAIDNLGKTEAGQVGIGFILTRINDPYRIGPTYFTTRKEWMYWHAVNHKLGKYLPYPY